MKAVLYIVLVFLVSFNAGAIHLHHHPIEDGNPYQVFKNISLPHNLSVVNSVFQDDRGMIWLGTRRGLYSYNGYDIHEFLCDQGTEANFISDIIQVDDRLLCLGTDKGLVWFDLFEERFVDPYPELEDINAVRSLTLYNGILWIGTLEDGLLTFNMKDKTIMLVGLDSEEEKIIYSMELAGDRLFIASYDHLSYWDFNTAERHIVDLGLDRRVTVYSVLYDKDNDCLWVGTEGFLFKCSLSSPDLYMEKCLEGNIFRTMVIDEDGSLLVGTDNGLIVYDPNKGSSRMIIHDSRSSSSLANNVVMDVLSDNNGNIWLATDRGVSIAFANAGKRFIHLSEIVQSGAGNMFTDILMDSRGNYWLGGENGLIRINNENEVTWFCQDSEEYHIRHNRIRHIYEDSDCRVWIATDDGIARYDSYSGRFIFYDIVDQGSGMTADWAYQIIEDPTGRLWVATYMGGIFVCDKERLLSADPAVPFTDISCNLGVESGLGYAAYDLDFDGDGNVWANTSKGLASIKLSSLEIDHKDLYMDNMIYFQGGIWYSSEGHLFCYDIVKDVNEEINFSADCRKILSFIKENNRLWFTSTAGLFCVDPKSRKVSHVSYEAGYSETGLYIEHTNRIVLGGEDILVSYDLDTYTPQSDSDSVFVTSINSNGNRLVYDKDYSGMNPRFGNRLILNKRGSLNLELSSYSYMSERPFYWKLDDEPWQPIQSGQNHLSFVHLPSGSNILRLCNVNPEKNPDAIVNEYEILIPFPWYLKWEYLIPEILLLLLCILALISFVAKKNKEKAEQLEKERMLEITSMKMDFFVNISHELKTPLSMIIAPVSKLLSMEDEPDKKETLQSVYNNALRLNTLIHKVLDFGRLEAESEDLLIRSHVEMHALLANCIATFKPLIEEKGISVSLDSEDEPIWAALDVIKMESVFINLLSNAIKYVRKRTGKVEVRLYKTGADAHIVVKDNGKGIDSEELSYVFVRFYQGQNRGDYAEGTGIGLFLVKKYVELHGGKIAISSKSGVTIEVTIPLGGENSIANGEAVELSSAYKDGLENILVIDDNREIVAFLAETLMQNHYNCYKVYDAESGLQLIRSKKISLVIVDQMMPEMDGFEFCRQLKKNSHNSTLPVIMLTAKDDMATELESIRLGIDAFIPKPFDVRKLLLRVAQLVQRKHMIEKAALLETATEFNVQSVSSLKSPDELFLEKVTSVIEQNIERENFNVSILAGILGLDTKQLYRKIKDITGSTPVNYIRKLRMKKAAALLARGGFTISEVMFLVGYSNASYFSKCFHDEFGQTPKEYASDRMSDLR